jgi:formate-dependent nitrite reductase membrane component NrfD
VPSPSPANPKKATEDRLEEIRREAAEKAFPDDNGRGPTPPPQIRGKGSYYGLPVLKAPVWTWEVALYFFVGGIAGVSAVIAFAAQMFGDDPALIRAALWVAIIGATVCPVLLIADLGRPSRFLNMLRVFKLQSPMSVGAWTLVAFSGCVFVALAGNELILRGYVNPPMIGIMVGIRWAGELTGALTGLILAAYTGVLISATAIPVWSHSRHAIPPHFLAGAVGGAAGILELIGFLSLATQVLGLVAAIAETLLGVHFELSRLPVNAPLHRGKSAWTFRIAGALAGPVALLLRLTSHSPTGRRAAAICFLVGALLARYAWIWAGVASAKDPEALFQIQRKA